jgi:hypothetical protein
MAGSGLLKAGHDGKKRRLKMRYLHHEAQKIVRYVQEHQLHVFRCTFDGNAVSVEASANIIDEMCKASETLWGTRLPYYAIASRSSQIEEMNLETAVLKIESEPRPDKFVVVAYQDGGLISVSGVELPFQIGADAAAWWAVTIRSAWAARLADWKKRLKWLK